MKKIIYYLAGIAAISCLVTGCEKDGFLEEHSRDEVKSSNPYRVTLNEALASADVLLTQLDGRKTRSSRQVKSVEYYTGADTKTRSAASDTLLYIVNYANDEGFAILGADNRMCPIYAISNEGQLNLADTVNNKGFAQCLAGIKAASPLNPGGGFPIDTTGNRPNLQGLPEIGPINPNLGERKITIYENIKPMISHNVSRWTQDEHFNDYCPVLPPSTVEKGAVGCGPLACTQIMSYYKWPQSFEGTALDWEAINSYEVQFIKTYPTEDGYIGYYTCPTVLAKFLAYVGKTLNARYGRDQNFMPATGVSPEDIRNNFYKFGYLPLSNPASFSYSTVPADLKNSPLLVLGEDSDDQNYGHVWVVDGYISYRETWDAIANETHSLYYSLYHCVWGWGGKNNGYFKWDSSNGMNTTPYSTTEAPADNSERIKNARNYINMTYFRNIKPSK